jgi:hypothetical protein
VSENRVTKKIIGAKREGVKGQCKNCVINSFIISILHRKLLGLIIEGGEKGEACRNHKMRDKYIKSAGRKT